jgi:hypothetical protein
MREERNDHVIVVGFGRVGQAVVRGLQELGKDCVVLDYGDEVIYTGFGGRNGSGRQIKDQEWIGANEGMRINIPEGLPVRVIRGPRGEPGFAPGPDIGTTGCTPSRTRGNRQARTDTESAASASSKSKTRRTR